MSDFEINIRTKADLAAANQAKAALEAQILQIRHAGGDASKLEAELSKVNAALSKAPNSDGLIGSLGKLGGLDKVAGTLTSVAGALALAGKAVSEFAGAESEVAKLDAALRQTGQLTSDYREQLQDLAGQLQETTGIADDEWLAVVTKLTQFGADSSNIEQSAEAVKNLAGVMGGDLQGAANLVARALQGNFDMFSRYGIHIDESGTKTERFNKLLQELALRGGGQLEAINKTLLGQFGQLKNGINDLFEAVGRWMSQTGLIQTALYGLSESLKWLGKQIGGTIPPIGDLTNAAKKTVLAFDEGAGTSKRFADSLSGVKIQATEAATELEKAKNKAKELSDLQEKIATAKRDEALAETEFKFKSGQIGELEMIERTAEINKKFSADQYARATELMALNINKNKQAIADSIAYQAQLRNEIVQEKERVKAVSDYDEKKAKANAVRDQVKTLAKDISDAEQPNFGGVRSEQAQFLAHNPEALQAAKDQLKRQTDEMSRLSRNANQSKTDFVVSTGRVKELEAQLRQFVTDSTAQNLKLAEENESLSRRLDAMETVRASEIKTSVYKSETERFNARKKQHDESTKRKKVVTGKGAHVVESAGSEAGEPATMILDEHQIALAKKVGGPQLARQLGGLGSDIAMASVDADKATIRELQRRMDAASQRGGLSGQRAQRPDDYATTHRYGSYDQAVNQISKTNELQSYDQAVQEITAKSGETVTAIKQVGDAVVEGFMAFDKALRDVNRRIDVVQSRQAHLRNH